MDYISSVKIVSVVEKMDYTSAEDDYMSWVLISFQL